MASVLTRTFKACLGSVVFGALILFSKPLSADQTCAEFYTHIGTSANPSSLEAVRITRSELSVAYWEAETEVLAAAGRSSSHEAVFSPYNDFHLARKHFNLGGNGTPLLFSQLRDLTTETGKGSAFWSKSFGRAHLGDAEMIEKVAELHNQAVQTAEARSLEASELKDRIASISDEAEKSRLQQRRMDLLQADAGEAQFYREVLDSMTGVFGPYLGQTEEEIADFVNTQLRRTSPENRKSIRRFMDSFHLNELHIRLRLAENEALAVHENLRMASPSLRSSLHVQLNEAIRQAHFYESLIQRLFNENLQRHRASRN